MANEQDKKILEELAKAEQDAKVFKLQVARVDDKTPSPEALKLIDRKLVLEYRLIPLFLKEGELSIGFADASLFKKPMPEFLVSLRNSYELQKYIIIPSDFDQAVKAYGEGILTQSTSSQDLNEGDARQENIEDLSSNEQKDTKPIEQKEDGVGDQIEEKSIDQNVTSKSFSSIMPVKNWPTIDLLNLDIPLEVLEKFPAEVAKKYLMVVFGVEAGGKEVKVATINPDDPRVKDIVAFVEKRNKIKVNLYKTNQDQIEKVLSGYDSGGYKSENSSQDSSKEEPIESSKDSNIGIEQAEPKNQSEDLSGVEIQRSDVDKIKQLANEEFAIPSASTSVGSDSSNSNSDPEPQSQPSEEDFQQQSQSVSKEADELSSPIAPQQNIAPSSPINISDNTQIPSPSNSPVAPVSASDVMGQFTDMDLDRQLNGPITDESQLEAVLQTAMAPKIVAGIISYAVAREVSDIHIEPLENNVLLRYRIDGILQEIAKMPKNLLAPIISRIKILSNLKIDEIRLPQDGRFSVKVANQEVDLRVSTLPAVFGEKAVLRILNKTTGVKEIEDLDFFDTNLNRVKKALDEPYGIILITGPTGSGKSTTLYAMLKRLNTPEVNIVTLEDPVEYQMEGINQTQIKDKIGYSFADGLRSIVRQDPDVIMVGEIRDKETATLSTQAALTGHLVLSTLHTNNAAGAIPRLIDMDVEPFLLSSSINSIIAQRLVRRLCNKCKAPAEVPTETLEKVKQILASSKAPEAAKALAGDLNFQKAVGCDVCKSGFKGRLGIFEVLTMSENLASLTVKKAITSELDEAARSEGMVSMRVDGVLKALKGLTTLDEILQVTAD